MLTKERFQQFVTDTNTTCEYLLDHCRCGDFINIDMSCGKDYLVIDALGETSVRAKYSFDGEKGTIVVDLSKITERGCMCSIRQLDLVFAIEHKPNEEQECHHCRLSS